MTYAPPQAEFDCEVEISASSALLAAIPLHNPPRTDLVSRQ